MPSFQRSVLSKLFKLKTSKIIILSSLMALSSTTLAANYTVTSSTDDGNVATVGSLSWAISQANAAPGNTIVIDSALTTISTTGTLPTLSENVIISSTNNIAITGTLNTDVLTTLTGTGAFTFSGSKGNEGSYSASSVAGTGGAGGDAVSGSGFTLTNSGTISGGTGGVGGDTSSGISGTGGTGGVGVTSTGNSTINNSGTINGGAAGAEGTGGIQRGPGSTGNAITLSGGGNVINLTSGGTINGNVVSSSGTTNGGDTLTTTSATVTGNISGLNTINLQTGAVVNGAIFGAGTVNVNEDFTTGGTIAATTVNVASTKALAVGHAVTAAVANAGTLDLNTGASVTGAISGAGTVNVNEDFTTEGTIAATTVNITASKSLSLGHDITATQVINDGTIDIAEGNSRNITGDYTQNAAGTLRIGVADYTDAGQLTVSGTATLADNANIDIDVNNINTLINGQTLSSVLSAGTLVSDGTFNITDNSALFNFSAVKDGNTVDLTLEQALAVADAVKAFGNTASTGAAKVFDDILANGGGTSEMDTAITSLGQLTTDQQVAEAVESTLPSFSAGLATVSQNATQSVTSLISSRQDSNRGLSSGDDFMTNRSMWFKPIGGRTEQADTQGVSGYDINSQGFALGLDGDVSPIWNIGGALVYMNSDVNSNSTSGSNNTNMDNVLAKAYATNQLDSTTALNLQVGLGLSNYDSTRRIFTGDVAKANYDGWQALASIELERSYPINDKTVLTPFVHADYSHVDIAGYQETGAGALNLNVDNQIANSLVIGAGVKAKHNVSNNLVLMANTGIGYDVLTERSRLTSSFAGGGASFTTEGIKQNDLVYRAGLQAAYNFKENTDITVSYDINGRQDYTDQAISAKVRILF
jgi:hypothetical protein